MHPEYETTTLISPDEVIAQYGKMSDDDLFLKLAELKNFDAAKNLFQSWDETYISSIGDYLIDFYQHINEMGLTRDQYIAYHFLKDLFFEWVYREPTNEQGLSL